MYDMAQALCALGDVIVPLEGENQQKTLERVLKNMRFSPHEGVDICCSYFLKTENGQNLLKKKASFLKHALASFGVVSIVSGFVNIYLNTQTLARYAFGHACCTKNVDALNAQQISIKLETLGLKTPEGRLDTLDDYTFTLMYVRVLKNSLFSMVEEQGLQLLPLTEAQEIACLENISGVERALLIWSLVAQSEAYRSYLMADKRSFVEFLYKLAKTFCLWFRDMRIVDEHQLQQTAFRLKLVTLIDHRMREGLTFLGAAKLLVHGEKNKRL